jgi:hypothetical protein
MNNPGLFEWDSSFDDSGLVTVRFIASDPYGMADTMDVDIDLAPVELFAMQIDTASVYSGESVDIAVYLKNKEAIDRYNVLINADPSVLTVLDVTNDGTRSQDLALFSFRTEDVGQPGDIRVKGSAEGGTPIGEGGGPIFVMRIHVSNNLLYVNNQVPITFALHTSLDNSLTLPNQEIVYDESINLFDGYIFIKSPGPIRIGDVNVNGVPFEIGDAVYFSNFFINPSLYPLDGKQLLNSDVNQDGIAPSIADLVLLVKVVTGETTPPVYPKASTTIADAATVELVHEEDGVYLETSAPVDLSGLLFTVTGPELDRQDVVNLTDMELLTYQRDGRLSALLISYDEKAVRSGDVSVLKISADPKAEISLEDAQLADRDGNPVEVELKKETVLPERFGLYQNFPNPFNPSTEIMFDLSAPSHVRLSVFNILGQEVIRLADKEYPASRHTVVWDGRNEAGRQVASGVYFYRIKTGETTASRKMVLLK